MIIPMPKAIFENGFQNARNSIQNSREFCVFDFLLEGCGSTAWKLPALEIRLQGYEYEICGVADDVWTVTVTIHVY